MLSLYFLCPQSGRFPTDFPTKILYAVCSLYMASYNKILPYVKELMSIAQLERIQHRNMKKKKIKEDTCLRYHGLWTPGQWWKEYSEMALGGGGATSFLCIRHWPKFEAQVPQNLVLSLRMGDLTFNCTVSLHGAVQLHFSQPLDCPTRDTEGRLNAQSSAMVNFYKPPGQLVKFFKFKTTPWINLIS
jgi:hypothetical protein